MVMLPDALTLILPEASMVMSLPAIVIVPSFFMVIEALPVVIVIWSPASIASFLPTRQRVALADRWPSGPLPTFRLSLLPMSALRSLPVSRLSLVPMLTERLVPMAQLSLRPISCAWRRRR